MLANFVSVEWCCNSVKFESITNNFTFSYKKKSKFSCMLISSLICTSRSFLLQFNEHTITVLGVQEHNWLTMSSNLHIKINIYTYLLQCVVGYYSNTLKVSFWLVRACSPTCGSGLRGRTLPSKSLMALLMSSTCWYVHVGLRKWTLTHRKYLVTPWTTGYAYTTLHWCGGGSIRNHLCHTRKFRLAKKVCAVYRWRVSVYHYGTLYPLFRWVLTSRQMWCIPPAGFFFRNDSIGLLSPRGWSNCKSIIHNRHTHKSHEHIHLVHFVLQWYL